VGKETCQQHRYEHGRTLLGRVLGKAHVKTYPLGVLKRGVMVGWGLGNPSGSLARNDCCSAPVTSGGPACRSSCAPSMWTNNHTRSQGGTEASQCCTFQLVHLLSEWVTAAVFAGHQRRV
jgi:hypothetical protein